MGNRVNKERQKKGERKEKNREKKYEEEEEEVEAATSLIIKYAGSFFSSLS